MVPTHLVIKLLKWTSYWCFCLLLILEWSQQSFTDVWKSSLKAMLLEVKLRSHSSFRFVLLFYNLTDRFLPSYRSPRRSRWPDDDVPFYIPQFYDGWQPPAPTSMPSSLPYENSPMSPSDSQRFPPGGPREPPLYMRVIYDFTARNNQELSMMKGDVVQVRWVLWYNNYLH